MSTIKSKSLISNSTLSAANGDVHVTTFNQYGHQVASFSPDPLKLLRGQVAFGALHNSKNRFNPPRCYPNTRTAILNSIDTWARDTYQESRPVMWLNGAAGAGKSAIVQTLMENWTSDRLIATSFFFCRTDQECNQKTRLVPTIVFQLLKLLPAIRVKLEEALELEDIFQKTLRVQMDELIASPLEELLADGSRTAIIVVDGLEECCADLPQIGGFPGQDYESQQAEILEALTFACKRVPSLRVLIASRADHCIRSSFEDKFFAEGLLSVFSATLSLNNHADANADILHFLDHQFARIRAVYPGLPPTWPSAEQLSRIVEYSSGCFIYPSIITRYILSHRNDPVDTLETVLSLDAKLTRENEHPLSQLDDLYRLILSSVAEVSRSVVRTILGCLCYHKELSPSVARGNNACSLATEAQVSGDYKDTSTACCKVHPSIFKVDSSWTENDPGTDLETDSTAEALLKADYSRRSKKSAQFFRKILFLPLGMIFQHLTDLHSLLDIPNPLEQHLEIRFWHTTFSQFLQNRSRSGYFYIEKGELHCIFSELYSKHLEHCTLGLSPVGFVMPTSVYDPGALLCVIGSRLQEIPPTKNLMIVIWIVLQIGWKPACCEGRACPPLLQGQLNRHTRKLMIRYLQMNLEIVNLPQEECAQAHKVLEKEYALARVNLTTMNWDILFNNRSSYVRSVSTCRGTGRAAPIAENLSEIINHFERNLAIQLENLAKAVGESVSVAKVGQGICMHIVKRINEKGIDSRSNSYGKEEIKALCKLMQLEANKALQGANEMHKSFQRIRGTLAVIAGDILRVSEATSKNIQAMTDSRSAESSSLFMLSDQADGALIISDQLAEWWEEVKLLSQNLDTGSLAQTSSMNLKTQPSLLPTSSTWEDLKRYHEKYIEEVDCRFDGSQPCVSLAFQGQQKNHTGCFRMCQRRHTYQATEIQVRNISLSMSPSECRPSVSAISEFRGASLRDSFTLNAIARNSNPSVVEMPAAQPAIARDSNPSIVLVEIPAAQPVDSGGCCTIL